MAPDVFINASVYKVFATPFCHFAGFSFPREKFTWARSRQVNNFQWQTKSVSCYILPLFRSMVPKVFLTQVFIRFPQLHLSILRNAVFSRKSKLGRGREKMSGSSENPIVSVAPFATFSQNGSKRLHKRQCL